MYVLRNKTSSEANFVRVYDDKEKRKLLWTNPSDKVLLQLVIIQKYYVMFLFFWVYM